MHRPFASVFGPASSQVLAAASSTAAAPFELRSAKPTCSPDAAWKPAPFPVSFMSVTVNVCDWPTRFVALDAIAIFASTHRLVAGPELPPVPFVLRFSVTPATATDVCALTFVTPVIADVSSIVQEPVPPEVVHGFGGVNPPGPLSFEKLICVPSGALTQPVPSFTSTCPVNVCAWPTRLTPSGESRTLASTTRSGSQSPVPEL